MNLFRWISLPRITLLLALLIMLDVVLFFGVSMKTFLGYVTIQGLALNTFGAAILAIPGIPQWHEWTTPEPLHTGFETLINQEELYDDDQGFEEIISLIDENTSRVREPDFVRLSIAPVANFGSQKITATVTKDEPAKWELTDTQLLQQWITDRREQKYRIPGIVMLGTGFIFQILSYLIG